MFQLEFNFSLNVSIRRYKVGLCRCAREFSSAFFFDIQSLIFCKFICCKSIRENCAYFLPVRGKNLDSPPPPLPFPIISHIAEYFTCTIIIGSTQGKKGNNICYEIIDLSQTLLARVKGILKCLAEKLSLG